MLLFIWNNLPVLAIRFLETGHPFLVCILTTNVEPISKLLIVESLGMTIWSKSDGYRSEWTVILFYFIIMDNYFTWWVMDKV